MRVDSHSGSPLIVGGLEVRGVTSIAVSRDNNAASMSRDSAGGIMANSGGPGVATLSIVIPLASEGHATMSLLYAQQLAAMGGDAQLGTIPTGGLLEDVPLVYDRVGLGQRIDARTCVIARAPEPTWEQTDEAIQGTWTVQVPAESVIQWVG